MNADENLPLHRATPADAETVGRMMRAFNDEFDTPGPTAETFALRLRSLLSRDDFVVLLSGDRQRPTGLLIMTLRPTLYADGPLGQIEEFYVVPELRGHGHGSALIQAAMRQVRSLSGNEMHIPVDEVDVDTRRFYSRHGFTNVERDRDGRQLLYTCALEDA
jgi:GNAT superfamily N-acetyltransferase